MGAPNRESSLHPSRKDKIFVLCRDRDSRGKDVAGRERALPERNALPARETTGDTELYQSSVKYNPLKQTF
jgi:hypothetical protein